MGLRNALPEDPEELATGPAAGERSDQRTWGHLSRFPPPLADSFPNREPDISRFLGQKPLTGDIRQLNFGLRATDHVVERKKRTKKTKGSQRSWTRWLDLVLTAASGTLATQFIRSGLTPKSRLRGPLLRPGGGLKPPNRLPGGGQAGLAAVLEEESAAADVAVGISEWRLAPFFKNFLELFSQSGLFNFSKSQLGISTAKNNTKQGIQ